MLKPQKTTNQHNSQAAAGQSQQDGCAVPGLSLVQAYIAALLQLNQLTTPAVQSLPSLS